MSHILRNIEHLRKIFVEGVKSVQPSTLFTNNKIKIIQEIEDEHNLSNTDISEISTRNYHIIGFGKAVLGMAVQLERILANKLVSGILSVPKGTKQKFAKIPNMMLSQNTVIKTFEGAENNLPDVDAMETAKKIKLLAESMKCNDILFVLISGGGSALLPLPKPQFTLETKLKIINKLTSQGAGIKEVNIVRIALSEIKGGKLAKLAKNAGKIVSLIISDIVNDPIDLIASGPTVEYDIKSNKSAKEILEQYNIWDSLEINEKTAVQEQEQEVKLETNYIYVIGNNKIATNACYNEAVEFGYIPFVLSTTIQGNVSETAKNYTNFLKNLKKFRNGILNKEDLSKDFPFDCQLSDDFISSVQQNKPLLIILAGEPTVIVKGNGKGGRNQELALIMSLEFYFNDDLKNISFLSAGTDGIDGPTIAAGAIGSVNVIEDFLKANNSLDDLNKYLTNNDSFTFYDQLENGKYHVITGHTGTNVMDLHLFVIP